MQVTPTNGDYRYSKAPAAAPADPVGSGSIDDTIVATIVQQVMATLPALAVPTTSATSSAAKNPWLDFAQTLASMVAASSEFRASLQQVLGKGAGELLKANGIEPGAPDQFGKLLDGFSLSAKGGTVVRAFWWGFHIQISHEDLQAFLGGAGTVNTIVDMIGGSIPSPAQPFIKLAAAFVAGALGLLGGLDHGRGVYVSMSWFAPGIFVPTSV
jgi:hypothetical protein